MILFYHVKRQHKECSGIDLLSRMSKLKSSAVLDHQLECMSSLGINCNI